jgi:hypothetical protein
MFNSILWLNIGKYKGKYKGKYIEKYLNKIDLETDIRPICKANVSKTKHTKHNKTPYSK